MQDMMIIVGIQTNPQLDLSQEPDHMYSDIKTLLLMENYQSNAGVAEVQTDTVHTSCRICYKCVIDFSMSHDIIYTWNPCVWSVQGIGH